MPEVHIHSDKIEAEPFSLVLLKLNKFFTMTPILIQIKSHTSIIWLNWLAKFQQDSLINVEIPRANAYTDKIQITYFYYDAYTNKNKYLNQRVCQVWVR